MLSKPALLKVLADLLPWRAARQSHRLDSLALARRLRLMPLLGCLQRQSAMHLSRNANPEWTAVGLFGPKRYPIPNQTSANTCASGLRR